MERVLGALSWAFLYASLCRWDLRPEVFHWAFRMAVSPRQAWGIGNLMESGITAWPLCTLETPLLLGLAVLQSKVSRWTWLAALCLWDLRDGRAWWCRGVGDCGGRVAVLTVWHLERKLNKKRR